jgi:hypothetical protein
MRSYREMVHSTIKFLLFHFLILLSRKILPMETHHLQANQDGPVMKNNNFINYWYLDFKEDYM